MAQGQKGSEMSLFTHVSQGLGTRLTVKRILEILTNVIVCRFPLPYRHFESSLRNYRYTIKTCNKNEKLSFICSKRTYQDVLKFACQIFQCRSIHFHYTHHIDPAQLLTTVGDHNQQVHTGQQHTCQGSLPCSGCHLQLATLSILSH